jgi:hypothetical protein
VIEPPFGEVQRLGVIQVAPSAHQIGSQLARGQMVFDHPTE